MLRTSTIFDYRDTIIETMEKEILFNLVKRERTVTLDMWEAYKNATLNAINGCSVEQLDKWIKDIRGEDAISQPFYELVIELFDQSLIDEQRFITIMQVIESEFAIELQRIWAISNIPRICVRTGVGIMRVVFENVMPKDIRKFISEIYNYSPAYLELALEFYPDIVMGLIRQDKTEFYQ